MLIKKIEYHTVHSHFDYDIPDEDIIAEFGSVEKFEEHFADETDSSLSLQKIMVTIEMMIGSLIVKVDMKLNGVLLKNEHILS